MSVLGFAAAKGAPGVTTLAFALADAWTHSDRQVLLVEADPDGGSIATGVLHGSAPSEVGLVQLALYRGADPAAAVREQCVQVEGSEFALLLGPGNPSQAAGAAAAWPVLAAGVRALHADPDLDVLIDLGRARSDTPTAALLPVLDRLVWVTTSNLASILTTRAAVTATRGHGLEAGVVLVGPDRPYGAAEIAEAVGAPVLGHVPHDRHATDHASNGTPRSYARFSPWHRAIHALTVTLQQPVPAAADPVAVSHG